MSVLDNTSVVISSNNATSPVRLSVILILLSSVIIILNLFAVIILVTNLGKRHSMTNFHVVSLAMTDTIVGVSIIPLLDTYMNSNKYFAYYDCLFRFIIFFASFVASMLHILGICVERALLSCGSININNKRCASFATIIVSWILAGLSVSVAFFHFQSVPSDLEVCSFDGLFRNKMINVIEYFGILFAVIQIPVLACMTVLLINVVNHMRQLKKNGVRNHNGSDVRICLTILVISSVFTICNSPLTIVFIINATWSNMTATRTVRGAVLVFAGLNSALNPVIYLFRIKEFRTSVIEITKVFRTVCRSKVAPTSSPVTDVQLA